ncbi:MAG: hydroxymethylpyrimidine/phosphomethylpyrimidine kinase, partial [Flavobacteriales bacterium 32-34-25]
MSTNRPFVLSIAGFDPSAGAGVLADIKSFEQHQVYGFAINTANTIQTENEFVAI